MAALTKRVELEQIVWQWERRDQIRRFALWLPRALSLGVIAFGLTWLILRLINAPLSAAIGGSLLVGVIAAVGLMIYWLRARPLMRAVQQFDQQLNLKERVSTALELLSGRIETVEEIAAYQLDDAYRTAQQVDIRQAVPLVIKWREWLILLLVCVICGLLVWGTQPAPVDALNPATRNAIENAADEVRDITESVANDTTLEAAERQTLLETLETSLDALETEPLSAEEAFASLSQVEDALRDQSNSLRQTTESQNATYEAAAQALNPESQSNSGESGISEFQKAIEEMKEELSSSPSPELTQEMQEAMEQASQMMQEANPQMAEYLENAAQAMEEGNTGAAQEALDQAASEAEQSQANQQQRESTAQSLEDAAQNASDASDNLSQSEQQSQSQSGSQPPPSQPGQQPSQNQSQGGEQPPEGQQAPEGQPPQPGSGDQEGSPGESGEGDNEQGSQSIGETGQSAPVEGPPPNSPGQDGEGSPEGDNPNSPGGTGGGAGDQSGPPQDTTSSNGQNTQDNNADGQGETTYESVYAPQRITAEGSGDMVLDPEASGQTVQEGEFQANPDGSSSVPYNQVFNTYNEAANQAIEGGYIPLSLRDVVQDYFISIAPEE